MSGVVRQILEEQRQAVEAAEVLAGLPIAAYESLAESRGVDLDDVVLAYLRDGNVSAVVNMPSRYPRPVVPPSVPPTAEARAIRWGLG